MLYFKNTAGEVFAYDTQAEREQFGAADLVAMTPAEIDAHLNPPAEPAPPPSFTALEFLDLFTEAEQLAIVTAGLQNAAVKLWYDRALAAQFITIADPRTAGGLAALVSAGLLTEERRAAIVEAMQ
jgi:hypothetical protein